MRTAIILALVAMCHTVSANWAWGGCENVTITPLSSFDMDAHTGIWYEIYRTIDTVGEWGADCVRSNVTKITTVGDVIPNHYNVAIQSWKWYWFFSYSVTTSTISWAASKATGYWSDFFLDVQGLSPDNYKIIAGDPSSSSLIYLCRPSFFGLARDEYIWFLSRNAIMSESLVNSFKQTLAGQYSEFDQTLGLLKTV